MEKLCFQDSTIRIEVAFLRATGRWHRCICWGGGGTLVFSPYNLHQTPRLPLSNIQSKYKQCACYKTYFLEKISHSPLETSPPLSPSCIKILGSPASRKPAGQPWLPGHAWIASSPVTSQDQDTMTRQRSQRLPSAGGKPFPDLHTRHQPAEPRPQCVSTRAYGSPSTLLWPQAPI